MRDKIITLLSVFGVLLNAPDEVGVIYGHGGLILKKKIPVAPGTQTYNEVSREIVQIVREHKTNYDPRIQNIVLFDTTGLRITEDPANPVALPNQDGTVHVTALVSNTQLGDLMDYLQQIKEVDITADGISLSFLRFRDGANNSIKIHMGEDYIELPQDRTTLFNNPDHVAQLLNHFLFELKDAQEKTMVWCFRNQTDYMQTLGDNKYARLTPETNAAIFNATQDLMLELSKISYADPQNSIDELRAKLDSNSRRVPTDIEEKLALQFRNIAIQVDINQINFHNTKDEDARNILLENLGNIRSVSVWTILPSGLIGHEVMDFIFEKANNMAGCLDEIIKFAERLKIEELSPEDPEGE